ncbi:sulfatase-like hydrolase/transferase [Alloalcanivorax venustensis]|uniref:sulfatase-like hydrolase/transferase n=1 Tax=Alloalcanivorax venustensis TaxID=172371 RepID=UPI00351579B9|tara:strand:+ start:702 stop:2669 length:1968 start_codon:yes stop_codon:yes gene_type:complete
MKQYGRCVGLMVMVWAAWYALLIGSGGAVSVETINVSFLRLTENFANWHLLGDILYFLFSQVLLILFLSIIIFWISVGLEESLKIKHWVSILAASVPVLMVIHLLNSLLYPVSITAISVEILSAQSILIISCVFSLLFILLAALRRKLILLQIALVGLALGSVYFLQPQTGVAHFEKKGVPTDQPNIIILGIDALRPAALSESVDGETLMPFLTSLLNEATLYDNAYTPVARTHAAWVSILSGRYPLNNGARFNLMKDSYIDKENLITHALKKDGYQTIWGLDERRFNNIDSTYGFDKVVGPEVGAADFIITKFSDLPAINIFANTRVGKFLFPYIYINRGNFVTYVPYQFNAELINALSGESPVFLAAHFCLPHYPFVNNMMRRIELEDPDAPKTYPNYLSMLELVDRQLDDLVKRLKKRGYLEDAIVYILSDHGEGFPGIDKPMANGNPYASFESNLFGHGTSLLTQTQYKILLARLEFKEGRIVGEAKKNSRLASLIDIVPDIVSSSDLNLNFQTDGVALMELPKQRHVILESSYSNEAVSASRINQLAVLQQSADAYEVDDQGRLFLQENLYSAFSQAKQRAVISSDDVMVALYPEEKESAFVVDLESHVWWPSNAFVPIDKKVWKDNLSFLCDFYKDDMTFAHRELCDIN